MTHTPTPWQQIAGTLDFQFAGWRAVYVKTIKGFGFYRTYRPDGSLFGTGGLPRVQA